eukprot:Skav212660  [mRNA]  locus=scaffold1227:247971:251119:- [translate_table: standard]
MMSRMAMEQGLLVTKTELPQVAATTINSSKGRRVKSWLLAHWMITGVAVVMQVVAPTKAPNSKTAQ